MEPLENNQCQLEPHTLYHGQPMEFVQHWRDVVDSNFLDRVTTRTTAAFCTVCSFLSSFFSSRPLTLYMIQHTVAIIESASDERVYECLSRDATLSLISHAQLTVDEHPEVRHRRRELHACRLQTAAIAR